MSANDLVAVVQQQSTAVDAATALLNGIVKGGVDAGDDLAKHKAAVADLQNSAPSLAAALASVAKNEASAVAQQKEAEAAAKAKANAAVMADAAPQGAPPKKL